MRSAGAELVRARAAVESTVGACLEAGTAMSAAAQAQAAGAAALLERAKTERDQHRQALEDAKSREPSSAETRSRTEMLQRAEELVARMESADNSARLALAGASAAAARGERLQAERDLTAARLRRLEAEQAARAAKAAELRCAPAPGPAHQATLSSRASAPSLPMIRLVVSSTASIARCRGPGRSLPLCTFRVYGCRRGNQNTANTNPPTRSDVETLVY